MYLMISIVIGLGCTAAALWGCGNGAFGEATQGLGEETAEQALHASPQGPEGGFSFEGPVGRFDRQQLQRGYQVYKEVCSACHSLKFVAFRDLAKLGFNEAEVKAEAASWRSEEHTSELQSLMRISYAVFCLKKKKYKYDTQQ